MRDVIHSTANNRYTKLKEQMQNTTDPELKWIIAGTASKMSVAHFYFKDMGCIKYDRDELFGTMDVIGTVLYNYIKPVNQPASMTLSQLLDSLRYQFFSVQENMHIFH